MPYLLHFSKKETIRYDPPLYFSWRQEQAQYTNSEWWRCSSLCRPTMKPSIVCVSPFPRAPSNTEATTARESKIAVAAQWFRLFFSFSLITATGTALFLLRWKTFVSINKSFAIIRTGEWPLWNFLSKTIRWVFCPRLQNCSQCLYCSRCNQHVLVRP